MHAKLPHKHSNTFLKAKKRWTLKQEALFFSLLADLLGAGFSLKQALQSLQSFMAINLTGVVEYLNTGGSFSASLKENISGALYCQLYIAEKHGNLLQTVQQLGQYLTKRLQQKAKLHALLIYPLLILGMLAFILSGIKIWLAPELVRFNSQRATVSYRQIENYAWYIGAIFSIVMFFYVLKIGYWWKKQSLLGRHSWYSGLPVLGKIYRQYLRYYLSFNLGLLLRSGLEFQQICELLQSFSSNTLLHQLGIELEKYLVSGRNLAELIKNYHFLPTELGLFFEKGKTQLEIGDDLLSYSKLAYLRLLQQMDVLLSWVQPLLFLLIAAIIIGTYLALLLPIYSSLGGMYT